MRRLWLVLAVFVLLAAGFGIRRMTAKKPASRPEPVRAAEAAAPTPAQPAATTPDEPPVAPAKPLVAKSPAGCSGSDSAVSVSLKSFLASQNADGSWGEGIEYVDGHRYTKTGATALALLAFLGAGYSPLSKDVIGEKPVGEAIAKAAAWLEANNDGDALNLSIAGLALNELYGLTGDDKYKVAAEAGLAKVAAAQGSDGSWSSDLLSSLMAAETLASARLSGMTVPDGAVDRAVAYLRAEVARKEGAAAAGLALLSRNDPSLEAAKNLMVSLPPDWTQQNWEYWYLGSLAMFQIDGPSGDGWKSWNQPMRDTLLRNQARDGTWPGTGGATAAAVRGGYGTLSLEIYYRYANATGTKSGPAGVDTPADPKK